MVLSYSERMQRSAERSRELAKHGRDIYPIPNIQDPAQRLACRSDLKRFCLTYLASWFSKPFGRPHLLLIESLQRILVEGGRQAVALPRGAGKSTLVASSLLWALLYGHRKYVCVLGANSRAAKKFIGLLGVALSTPHTPLARDFPDVCYPFSSLGGSYIQARGQHLCGRLTRPSCTSDTIILPSIPGSPASGSRVVAMGINSATRGQSAETPDGQVIRPDTLLLDDVQTDSDSVSPARIEKLQSLIAGALKGLAQSGSRLAQISTCTVCQADDLADRLLNDPLWNGIRTSAVESMPDDMDAWRTYRDILYDEGEDAARQYYLDNYSAMNKGAVTSWPDDYDPAHFVDALHYEMTNWAEDERSFYSERQNKPQRPTGLQAILSAGEICRKLSHIPQYSCHPHTHKITAAIDCHDDILFYSVLGLSADYTGSILTYGSYPKQSRPYFHRGSGIVDLQRIYGGEPSSNLLQGLVELLTNLNQYRFSIEGMRGELPISRILIDSGWRGEVVAEAIRRSNVTTAMCCKGISVRSYQKPMNEWPKKQGRVIGWHCVEERINGKVLLLVDVNYWKSKIHESLAVPAGQRGELTIYGDDPTRHKMFADHLVAETPRIEEGTNTVISWCPKPNTENHYLDTVVYSLAAGVSLGLRPSDCII